jgi:urate oxidase
MGIRLGRNNYGKSRVRLLRVVRGPDGNQINEFTVAIRFEGDFETVHTLGDNTKVLPTDTMKNTVYALAQKEPVVSPEAFAQRLIQHFLKTCPEVNRVEVDIREDLWARADSNGKAHATAFVRTGEHKRTAFVSGTREGTTIRAGVQDLVVMKTAHSAFVGFQKDQYTTLKEDRDRIMATSIQAAWLYGDTRIDFNKIWDGVCQTLVGSFADHESLSLQHTLYAMGKAVLEKYGEIREIRLSLPNKHYNFVNLSHFGLDNSSEVFLPTDEPHGLIEGTVTRD